ncbi:hypothetical protein J5N97_011528 [Dioscorea zingiberensis]|uniref:glutamate formimidoyltransferase n=1 Tax=Dioscorea zingiberensis TaxID=325984 RepID=A0A9D5D390_9LILI|nr:hypothetical protein J5N97_011528 [Dioscorea zingiberensis]
MLKSMLACCKLYISESRNAIALDSIERAAKLHPEAIITNIFKDEVYNRVGYTIVSHFTPANSSLDASSPLKRAVFSMVKAALEAIDLELHSGTHPRVGVVDHICFHPLAQASMDQAAGLANSLAADIGHKLQVPTFVYGGVHERGKTLDAIRRELGYFKPSSSGNQWTGGLPSDALLLKPDHGPTELTGNKGVVIVGATRWVDNYNVPVLTTNIEAVRRIARRVSGRGGGLQSVQAMGLVHGENSTEVACNLLDPSSVGADQVQLEVQRLAHEEGLAVCEGYFTDFSQERVIETYLRTIKSLKKIPNLQTRTMLGSKVISLARPPPAFVHSQTLIRPTVISCVPDEKTADPAPDPPARKSPRGSSQLNRWSMARSIRAGRRLARPAQGKDSTATRTASPIQPSISGADEEEVDSGEDDGEMSTAKEIYMVSDGTGWTAEHSVNAALGQFEHCLVDRGCAVNTHLFSMVRFSSPPQTRMRSYSRNTPGK